MNIEQIEGTSNKRVHAWREKNSKRSYCGLDMVREAFSYLCRMIESKEVAVACVGSTLFDIATNCCTIEERVKTPMPSNFRVVDNGLAIEFDYPKSFERESGYRPDLVRPMISILEAAAGCDEKARQINLVDVVSVTVLDNGTLQLHVHPSGREEAVNFTFAFLSRKEAGEVASMEEPPDYYVIGEGPKWIEKFKEAVESAK